ncbi:MAG: hypothetical protein O3A00_15495 [Planctomycetota bacterium]|nr:hypothetical protein [Planctomycetota bacterium]
MFTPRMILAVTVCVACGGSSAMAAPTADEQLEAHIKNLVEAAKQAQVKSVLVVVREDERSRPDRGAAGVLNEVQAKIEAGIRKAGLTVVDGTSARRLARAQKAKRLPKSAEVAKFRAEAKFDALVAVDYRLVRPSHASMRITMLDDVDRLFLSTAQVSEEILEQGRSQVAKPQVASVGRPNLNPARIAGLGALIQAAQAQGLGRNTAIGSTPGSTSPSKSRDAQDKSREGRPAAPAGNNEKDRNTTEAPPKADAGPVEPKAAKEAVDNNPDIGRLNKKVVEFCVANLGKQVGNGECWTLANEALIYAKAKPAVWYTFGRQIGLDEVIPGDILQFETARFDEANSYATMGAPNHTAVVYSVQGKNIFILQQNFGKRIVTTYKINFDNMTQGKAWAYRPVSR